MELSDVDLSWSPDEQATPAPPTLSWPAGVWWPRATRLHELTKLTPKESTLAQAAVEALQEANRALTRAQLQVGYRVRDEVVLFCLHAEEVRACFRDQDGASVDPLDLAMTMKILPRVEGGSQAIAGTLRGLLAWAMGQPGTVSESAQQPWLEAWRKDRRPRVDDARFPITAARLLLMLQRLEEECFTSFWL